MAESNDMANVLRDVLARHCPPCRNGHTQCTDDRCRPLGVLGHDVGDVFWTLVGRRLLVDRVLAGRPQSHVARELGVSRQCVSRWVSRFRTEGPEGLRDRSSRPIRSPSQAPAVVRQRLLDLRVRERLGPPELARRFDVSASTASRVTRLGGSDGSRL